MIHVLLTFRHLFFPKFRIILMKHLGADDKEIDDFRRKHMSFESVRKYYIKRAKEDNDTEEEIRFLVFSTGRD